MGFVRRKDGSQLERLAYYCHWRRPAPQAAPSEPTALSVTLLLCWLLS